MKFTFPRAPDALTDRLGRGCVPRLPAPGCPPDRPMDLEEPCFPVLDFFAGHLSKDRRSPTAGKRRSRRTR